MFNRKLRKAIGTMIGAAALAGVSGQASAVLAVDSLGTFTGTTISLDQTSPYKAFTDYSAKNQGWVHTSKYLTLTVGTPGSGATYDVQLSMTSRGAAAIGNSGSNAMDNPAFAVWTMGTNTFTNGAGVQHGWNPTRGPNDSTGAINTDGDPDTLNINDRLRVAGVLDGHVGWIGYVNSGPTYTLVNEIDPLNGDPQTGSGLPVNDAVSHGGLNTSSLTWLTNPGASSTSYTNDYFRSGSSMVGTSDTATMTLFGLKAGNYFIATGGSCPSPTPATACGQGQGYTFTVSSAAAPVPVPAAVWLFGSALAGMGVIGRRKDKAAA